MDGNQKFKEAEQNFLETNFKSKVEIIDILDAKLEFFFFLKKCWRNIISL